MCQETQDAGGSDHTGPTIVRTLSGPLVAGDDTRSVTDGGPVTTLTAVYPVLIAASGLWARGELVAFITAQSIIGYVVLLVEAQAAGKPIGFRAAHIDFLASLALMVLISAHQVRHVRVLGSLIDEASES